MMAPFWCYPIGFAALLIVIMCFIITKTIIYKLASCIMVEVVIIHVICFQDPTPKTEDQLEEDERVMLQLGTDAQGMELRTRMMSASLLSDMESFKVISQVHTVYLDQLNLICAKSSLNINVTNTL